MDKTRINPENPEGNIETRRNTPEYTAILKETLKKYLPSEDDKEAVDSIEGIGDLEKFIDANRIFFSKFVSKKRIQDECDDICQFGQSKVIINEKFPIKDQEEIRAAIHVFQDRLSAFEERAKEAKQDNQISDIELNKINLKIAGARKGMLVETQHERLDKELYPLPYEKIPYWEDDLDTIKHLLISKGIL
jgi:hypothetical protein